MTIKESLYSLVGLLIVIVMMMIPIIFIKGAAWASSNILPWASLLTWILLIVEVIIILPLAIARKTRLFSIKAMINFSYVFGATLWMEGLLLTLSLWGVGAVVVGMFLAGVGVVPIAMLATAFNGLWAHLIELVILAIMTFGSRFGALSLAESLE